MSDERHGIQNPDDGRIQPPPPVARPPQVDDEDDLDEVPLHRAPENRSLAVWSHWGGYLTWIVVPLVFYTLEKDKRSLVAWHAREALNFQITIVIQFLIVALLPTPLLCLIAMDPLLVLVWAGVTVALALALGIGELIVVILAALAASRGERYSYPLTIRFVPRPSEEPSPYDDRE